MNIKYLLTGRDCCGCGSFWRSVDGTTVRVTRKVVFEIGLSDAVVVTGMDALV